jgi:hypothetical protein
MTAAEQKQTAEHLAAVPAVKAHVDELGKLKGSHQALDAEIKKTLATHAAERTALTLSTAAHKAYADVVKATKVVMEEFADAAEKDIAAVQADYAGSVEGLAAGMANQIGAERGLAAVKVVSETAKGLACLAEGTWPPTNPAAIIAAGIHFDSAAEWAKLAGTSAARHGAGAAGGGAGYQGIGDRGQGTSDRGQGTDYGERAVAGTGLAPGAQGSPGGRLNVMVLGEAETARFFADSVNAADAAGHFMQVSTARKSAPAQG